MLTQAQTVAVKVITDSQKEYKYSEHSTVAPSLSETDDVAIIFTQTIAVDPILGPMQRLEALAALDAMYMPDIIPLIEPSIPIDLYEMKMYRIIMKGRVETPLTSQPTLKQTGGGLVVADKSCLVGLYRERFVDELIRKQIVKDLMVMRDNDPTVAMDVRPCVGQIYPKTMAELDEIRKSGDAMIHDLIDPNVNLGEHPLWIPSEFDAKNGKAISGIVNLDSHRYPLLHQGIERLIALMIPMVSDILRLSIHTHYPRVKCIVKAMDYILPPQSKYEGNLHREGIGEGIVAVGIYYPHTSAWMDSDGLELTAIDEAMEQVKFTVPCKEGSVLVFSNEVYHRLIQIRNPSETNIAHRMIMAFFFVHPLCGSNEVPSNMDIRTNMRSFVGIALSVWMRESMDDISEQMDLSWLHFLVGNMVTGDRQYRYNCREKFRVERGVPFDMPEMPRLRPAMYEGMLDLDFRMIRVLGE